MFLSQIMIVDWANLKKRLISLFEREDIKNKLEEARKVPTQVLNYKFGDHIYNLFLSFLGETHIEKLMERNIRILIYGAWELESKWLNRISSFLEEPRKENNKYDKEFILYLWKNGFLYKKGVKRLISEFLGEDVGEPEVLWERRLIYYLERYKPFITIRRGVISLETQKSYLENFAPGTIFVPRQKRVDMLMGIDITSYSFKLNPVEFLLICNDQDILPALKVAKRNGAVISSCFFEEERANEDILSHSDRVRVLRLTELEGGLGKMKIMDGKMAAY